MTVRNYDDSFLCIHFLLSLNGKDKIHTLYEANGAVRYMDMTEWVVINPK